MIDQDLQQRFLELPRSRQDLITSDFSEDAAALFGENLHLTEEQVDIFENGIVLMLLYIFTAQDLKEYLAANTEASRLEIHNVVSTIAKIVGTRPEPTPVSRRVTPIQNPLQSHPLPITQATPSPSQSLAEEIRETEQSFAGARMRTMAGDMQAVGHGAEAPVYQSSQDVLLNRSTPSVPPPAPESRWDSEHE